MMKKWAGLCVLMATIAVIAVASLAKSAASPIPQTNAPKAYLKIHGIEGDSTDQNHEREIELQAFGWGGTRIFGTSLTGAAPGPLNMQTLSFTMRANRSSTKIFQILVSNQKCQQAILTLRNKLGKDYLFLKLTDIYVISYKTAANMSQDEVPLDQVEMSFVKLEMQYIPVKPNGATEPAVSANWSFSPIL